MTWCHNALYDCNFLNMMYFKETSLQFEFYSKSLQSRTSNLVSQSEEKY